MTRLQVRYSFELVPAGEGVGAGKYRAELTANADPGGRTNPDVDRFSGK